MSGMEGVVSGKPRVARPDAVRDARAAVAAAFDAHHDRLYSYVARRLGREAAEDLVAETFATAYARWRSYDPARGGLEAWLFGIVANLLRRHRRREARQWRAYARTGADPLVARDADADARVDATAAARRLAGALAAMPARDREVLLLYAWADLRYEEIAAALDVPVGTVRSRLNRARRVLREHLEEDR